jgi:hypothetical protein
MSASLGKESNPTLPCLGLAFCTLDLFFYYFFFLFVTFIACTRKRARKQELIVDEFDARCKRVQQQSMHDTEAHKYLIKKLENEANLAQQMCEKAEIEQEMLKEQREHQKKKQEIEMQLAENHKNFERKKQEMEIEFLKTKHCLELEKLKN